MIAGQTIIEFDIDLHWQPSLAWLDAEERGYYVAPMPHLVVLVIHSEGMKEIDGMARNIYQTDESRIWDCNVGYHKGSAPVDYVSPEGAGYEHSKITLRRRLPANTPPDLKLSTFLEGCPTLDKPFGARVDWRQGKRKKNITLPDALWDHLIEMAARRGMTIEQLIWRIGLDYVIENV